MTVGDEQTGRVRMADAEGRIWEYQIPPGTYVTEETVLLHGDVAGGVLHLTRADGKRVEVEAHPYLGEPS